MAAVCAVLILGQIYFDLSLPDRMSELTVLIKTPGSAMDDILRTGLDMMWDVKTAQIHEDTGTPDSLQLKDVER